MSPRRYRMQQRETSSIETRERIVRATAELHHEKGVAATTFRDIAERADVGIGTVYHHFPSYEHVITACGEYSFAIARPPLLSIFDGIGEPRQRVRMLVRELIGFYQRVPAFSRVRGERTQFAALEKAFSGEEAFRRDLIAEALRPLRPNGRVLAVAFALLDVSTYESLLSAGLAHNAALDEITTTLLARIEEQQKRKK